MIFKKFNCPTYNAKIWYITDCDHLECKRVLEKNLKAEIDNWDHEDSMGFTEIYSDPNVFVLYVTNRKDLPTLVHEITHLSIEILRSRGINIEEGGGEVLAYYHEFWFRTLTNIK